VNRPAVAIAGLLIALAFAVYHPVAGHEFIHYDDPIYILENPNLEGGLGAEALIGAFTRPYETNWIPLTWISLQIDHALYQKEPAGYLLTNVALHALSCVLLFAALLHMTRALAPSAFVAAVFAVHPLHVESVAWASERKDALAGVFWMLGLLAWGRYAQAPGPRGMFAVATCLGLGLLAKPVLVTFPFALLLLDFWPLGRLGGTPEAPRLVAARVRSAVFEKWPLFALVVASSVVTYVVQRETGAMSADGTLPFGYRIANGLESLVIYLENSVWPSGLAIFYPHPLATVGAAWAASCGLALAVVSAVCLWGAQRRPHLAVGWLWYLGTLVPMIGLVQVGMQARADRYMYIPLIGLSIGVAWEALRVVGSSPVRARWASAAGTFAIVALAVTAYLQVTTWRNTETVFAQATAVTEGNFLAHHSLGSALLAEGRLDEAEPHLTEALRLKPRWAAAHAGMGDLRVARGDSEAAVEAFRQSLELAPKTPGIRIRLARALERSGNPDGAIAELRRALRQDEDVHAALIHGLLANALLNRGDPSAAIGHYERALALAPDQPAARANLGFALLRIGRVDAAREALETALAAGADPAEVEVGLAEAAARRGDVAAALTHYRRALRAEPSHVPAVNNLAWVLATHPDASLRSPEEAIRMVRAAVSRSAAPDPALLDTLAAGYAAAGRFGEAVDTASRALQLCLARGDADLAGRIRARLALYLIGRPYREPTRSQQGDEG
jgi:tetratricopeptide (TPR) repeat protein